MLDHIPLEAFRVFDAACRQMNFSKAGRELNITQAAVSRRIKGVEDHLGTALFTRRGKNLELTPQGARLFQRVRAALDYLEESLDPFRPAKGGTIAIAASGSVSHLWLGGRLRDFGKENPSISLRLLTSDTSSDLAAETNDIVILYSTGEHPRWDLTLMIPERLMPVASPDYLDSRGLDAATLTLERIAALDLIDYERFNAHWISFRQWFSRVSPALRLKLQNPRFSFSTYIMAIDAALRGDGIALGSLGLIEDQLADGRLVAVGAECLSTGYGYYLGLPKDKTVTPEARQLHAFLSGSEN